MEDQAEKMVALKKAYAEIILNTAKEAAARVMVSERKALRFQQDLRNTKDEALRMLLRLKQMIDAKTTEAETTSLGQQKRIEELDAQLNEAEGVIVDLRAELRKAYDQLEEVKNSHMRQSNGPLENEHTLYFENAAHEKKLDITEQFRSSAQCGSCCNRKVTATSDTHLNNFLIDNPNLASIIIGSKEPELYRNGYTHRIRAIERNLLDGKNLSEDEPPQEICTKKGLIINEDKQNLGNCAPSSINAENIDTNVDTENLDGSKAFSINSSVAKDQPVKARTLPRSSVRYARSNPKVSRFCPGQSIKPTTEPEKVNFKENSLGKDENLTENNEQSAGTLRRSIRKRKVRCWDDISSLFKSRAVLSRCKKYSGNDVVKFDEHRYKSKSVAEVNQVIVPITPSTYASEETKDNELPGPLPFDVVKDAKLINETMVGKDEVAGKEAPRVSSSNFIIETDKALGADSVLAERTGGAASDSDKNRILKYTFSRKRKKDLLSKSDNRSSPGKSFLTGKMGEKPEKEKPNLIEDPSSDSQNMVEVACQLISLSGEPRW